MEGFFGENNTESEVDEKYSMVNNRAVIYIIYLGNRCTIYNM